MRVKLVVAILVLLAVDLLASPVHAEGVVTSCDVLALRAALAGGGRVTFACSGTITTYDTITISTDTTIDGSGQAVTITGVDMVRVFLVDPGVTLDLNAMTVANGAAGNFDVGGGMVNLGTLNVTNSTFYGNSAGTGGGIYNEGAMAMSNSTLFGNSANNGDGGGILNAGTLIVSASTLSANRADHGLGGAIASRFTTTIISDSLFMANSAIGGGAVHLHGGTADVSNSRFVGNRGVHAFHLFGGGAIRTEGATVTVSNSTFSDNDTNRSGGGIFNYGGGSLHVSNSTFSGNRATGTGGGISNSGTTTVSNSTFSSNSAGYAGGGISNWGPLGAGTALTVTNSTLSHNSSVTGGGIYNRPDNTLTLENSVVANSSTGSNCLGPIAGVANLSYPDATCPGMNADPMLGPLQDNGGPTFTMEPGLASPAIDGGNDITCQTAPVRGHDQRGVTRPQGAHCDIGAVERVLPFRFWLPIVRS